jgi:transposase
MHSPASSKTERLCLSDNAAERELRAVVVGRRNWTLRPRSTLSSPLAKLNDIDLQAWLSDVQARLPDYPATRIHDLLPWN